MYDCTLVGSYKESKIVFGFRQTQQYLFYFTMATSFGQLTTIRPSLQNSEQGATQRK
jgi:hypothetical protein